MIKEIFTLQDDFAETIYVYKWYNQSNDSPKASIMIIHGMAEHAQRYELFANALVDAGFVVYASDHRGHGKTAGNFEKTGYFSDSDGWNLVIENLQQLKKYILNDQAGSPLFIFGHSMGSLLLRNLIFSYPEKIDGIILSGTSYTSGPLIAFGKIIAQIQILFKGKKHRSKLLEKLSFGSFNSKFKPSKTEFDWLSRDEMEVDQYIKDDYCGFRCTAQMFADLFDGLKKIQKKSNLTRIPRNFPVLIMAGSKDAVGNFTKGTLKVKELFTATGLKNTTIKIYENARHELTNEINKYDVYKDVIQWMENTMKTK